jgi:7-cyano-7-deazaguanine synthase
MNKKKVVISLSGGMDSTTLALYYLGLDYEVLAISFNYGQKHVVELERAESFCNYLKEKELSIRHEVITISENFTELLNSTLVKGGDEVPEGHYQDETMKLTVVPNRNKLFSSFLQSIALSWAMKEQDNVMISLGIHAGDHDIYPDCRQEFRDADNQAFRIGNWESEKVNFEAPFIEFDKTNILKVGVETCVVLDLDFSEVYKRTITSYKPILINGVWYSDYKSASSVERIESFLTLKIEDPEKYADETGLVSWETVVKNVKIF